MDAKLVVVGGDAKAAEVKLKLPTTVGRGREVTLTLPHPLVSRQHCEIYARDGRLFVKDLGSLNGTFINNQRIEGEAELPAGDLLTIGTVTFRAIYEEDASLRPPEAEEDDIGGTMRTPSDGTVHVAGAVAQAEPETEKEQAAEEAGDDFDFDELAEFDDPGEDDELAGIEDPAAAEADDVEVEAVEDDEDDLRAVGDTDKLPNVVQQDSAAGQGDDDDDDLASFLQGLD